MNYSFIQVKVGYPHSFPQSDIKVNRMSTKGKIYKVSTKISKNIFLRGCREKPTAHPRRPF